MTRIPVYKYDAEGNFICKYESHKAAASDVKRVKANIRKAIIRKNKSAGFYFSEIYFKKYPAVQKSPKVILAYKKTATSTWMECRSLKQAALETNIPAIVIKWLLDKNDIKNTTIFKDLRGSNNVKDDVKFYLDKAECKPVPLILLQGKSKKEYKSIKAASLFLEVSTTAVSKALKNNDKLKGWLIKRL